MNWITENLCESASDGIGGMIEMFGDAMNDIFYFMVKFGVENVYIKNAEKMIIALTLSLAALVTLKVVLSGYITETDYDSEADPFNLIIRLAECVAVTSCSAWIFDYLLARSRDFASDLIGSADASSYTTRTEVLLNIDIGNAGKVGIAYMVLMTVICISFVVLMVVSGLRGGELVVMKLFLPFFSLDLLTTSRERWNNFIMGYMMAFFTYAIQILFLIVSLKCYATAEINNPLYFIATIVFMIIAIKAPKFLEKYIYKTGVGGAAGGGLRMVAQTLLMKNGK